ncbi:MAG: hypothetical protein ACE5O2_13325, partial [Armatimonadota bacterium]
GSEAIRGQPDEEPQWVSVPARMAALLAGVYVAWCVVAPGLPPMGRIAGTLLSVTVSTALSVGVIYHTARVPTTVRGEIVGALLCVGMWVGLLWLSGQAKEDARVGAVVGQTFFIFGATFAAKGIARTVRHANLLLPIAVVAVIFDAVYVFWGPTGRFVDVAPDAVAQVSVAIPVVGGVRAPEATQQGFLQTSAGPGDILFVAFILAACLRLRLNARGAYMAIVPLIIAAACFVEATGLPLPGWLVIAPGFLATNYEHFVYTPDEKRAMLQAALAVVILVAVTLAAFHWSR